MPGSGSGAPVTVAPLYISRVALKLALKIPDTDEDAELDRLNAAASRNIDQICGLWAGGFIALAVAEARQFTVNTWATRRLFVDPFTSLTSVATDENGDGTFEVEWAESDYITHPLNGSFKLEIRTRPQGRYSFPVGDARVEAVAKWGVRDSIAPDDIAEATLLQINRWRARDKSPAGVLGNAVTGGLTIADMDPDVVMILRRGNWLVGQGAEYAPGEYVPR